MARPVTDVDTLKQFIRDRTRETWNERGIPYYLSYVAIDLKKLEVDYHNFIGALRLSQWASSTDFPETKFVTHPYHKAKVGFVPADVDFSFDDAKVPEASTLQVITKGKRGRDLVQFVESLMNLPDSALADFQVPAKVLIALLRK